MDFLHAAGLPGLRYALPSGPWPMVIPGSLPAEHLEPVLALLQGCWASQALARSTLTYTGRLTPPQERLLRVALLRRPMLVVSLHRPELLQAALGEPALRAFDHLVLVVPPPGGREPLGPWLALGRQVWAHLRRLYDELCAQLPLDASDLEALGPVLEWFDSPIDLVELVNGFVVRHQEGVGAEQSAEAALEEVARGRWLALSDAAKLTLRGLTLGEVFPADDPGLQELTLRRLVWVGTDGTPQRQGWAARADGWLAGWERADEDVESDDRSGARDELDRIANWGLFLRRSPSEALELLQELAADPVRLTPSRDLTVTQATTYLALKAWTLAHQGVVDEAIEVLDALVRDDAAPVTPNSPNGQRALVQDAWRQIHKTNATHPALPRLAARILRWDVVLPETWKALWNAARTEVDAKAWQAQALLYVSTHPHAIPRLPLAWLVARGQAVREADAWNLLLDLAREQGEHYPYLWSALWRMRPGDAGLLAAAHHLLSRAGPSVGPIAATLAGALSRHPELRPPLRAWLLRAGSITEGAQVWRALLAPDDPELLAWGVRLLQIRALPSLQITDWQALWSTPGVRASAAHQAADLLLSAADTHSPLWLTIYQDLCTVLPASDAPAAFAWMRLNLALDAPDWAELYLLAGPHEKLVDAVARWLALNPDHPRAAEVRARAAATVEPPP